MDYVKVPVEITEYDKLKDIISELSPYDDLVTLEDDLKSGKAVGVSCFGDSGVFKIGELSEKTVRELRSRYGAEAAVFENDFGIYKREDGTYRMWLGLEISPAENKEGKGKGIVPVMLCISTILCAITAVILTIDLIIKLRKKSQ
jgi:hypothetical protein